MNDLGGASLGFADLTFGGDFEHRAQGRGVQLLEDDDGHCVRSGDLAGPDAQPRWQLTAFVDDDTDEPFAELVTGSDPAGRSYSMAGGTLEFYAGAYHIDARLETEGGGPQVHIKGRIDVPRWPGPGPAHAEVLAAVRGAGHRARPYALVAHGQAEPLSKDPALISILADRESGHDTAEDIRDILPDGWTAFVGEDEPGNDSGDIVFEQQDGGPPVPVDDNRIQVLCSPSSDAEVLAWSRFGPPDCEFGAGHLLTVLERWRQSFDFELIEACHDTLVLQLEASPADFDVLAAEVLALAPDIADYMKEKAPGLSAVAATARRIRDLGDIEMWWD